MVLVLKYTEVHIVEYLYFSTFRFLSIVLVLKFKLMYLLVLEELKALLSTLKYFEVQTRVTIHFHAYQAAYRSANITIAVSIIY